MIKFLIFLSAFLIDISYEEDFREFQETYHEFYNDHLIAPQENREDLLNFVHAFSEKNYTIVQTLGLRLYQPKGQKIRALFDPFFERYIKEGSTVVDYGAGNGLNALLFSQLAGFQGKLIAIEPTRCFFKELFWNMTLNQIQNAQLYCMTLNESEHTLDSLNLKDVSFIRINANGQEGEILNGAKKTIRKCRPALLIKMLGGIPIERADRYIKQEFRLRMEEIHNMGYTTTRINESEYLALPIM